ncbi:NUDIX domain-containing protein [Salinicola corii]|uniref:NUDIX domain-containing protein n=1 Tax=Salinicola corii TaxID=2606937 RepID=A0A640WIP7_9GAMM|nr:NUDIX domain-containing protein [Salinicola corii]KAA0020447.1 NUDIX domain-containing protein [Salinicola corii]
MADEPFSGESSITTATLQIAAAVIVDQHQRILLVRKRGSRWFMLAGGKLDAGETPEQALRREIREELGVQATDAELIGEATTVAANEADHRVHAHLFWTAIQGQAGAHAEIAEIRWVDCDEAVTLPLAPLLRSKVLAIVRSRLGLEPACA